MATPPGQTRGVDDDRRRRMCDGKARYKDQAAADLAARNIEWGEDRGGIPLRTYSCDYCGRWHLTSQPRR